jgi:hypothetical protein
MTHRSDDSPRAASDRRFHEQQSEIATALRALLGARCCPEPIADPDRAAALAVEARATHRDAEPNSWAVARRQWTCEHREREHREHMVGLLHAISARLGSRPTWLVLPGREPQVVPVPSDAVMDNPLGFAALAGFELLLSDQAVPAGLWLMRHTHGASGASGADAVTWELEVWGEPWLSATTRALRECPETGELG